MADKYLLEAVSDTLKAPRIMCVLAELNWKLSMILNVLR
jgi:hypothetical protein